MLKFVSYDTINRRTIQYNVPLGFLSKMGSTHCYRLKPIALIPFISLPQKPQNLALICSKCCCCCCLCSPPISPPTIRQLLFHSHAISLTYILTIYPFLSLPLPPLLSSISLPASSIAMHAQYPIEITI